MAGSGAASAAPPGSCFGEHLVSGLLGRLLKLNPTACPVTSPAVARPRELQKQAREAGTGEERLKAAGLLAEWEQKFMAQP